ncbi:MAG TPA: metallophosphoesterase [Gemmatimonadaceae bacterium]|nr:metallophosphoesterase [Gemmatimonadaceae bacterium]
MRFAAYLCSVPTADHQPIASLRLLHVSDLHLGYRQYQRLTPGGINQREADVAATFRTTIDRMIALEPDVVVVAGDVFHTVRPTNQAIVHAFVQFSRLVQALPRTSVVLVAGNHDTPRSTETGGILQLFTQLGVHVVDREARRIPFPARSLSLLCVPDVPGLVVPSLTPDPAARINVLVVHGEVQGILPVNLAVADPAAVQITREELTSGQWDYIALGHYHVYREVASNAFYSGSIDYTSVNTWGELYEQRVAKLNGKGFVERDLTTGEHVFHELPPARPLVDLPSLAVAGLTAPAVDKAIRSIVDACPGGIDDKIVRLVVRDLTRSLARELDHKAIRDYKRRALVFNLDVRPPETRIMRTSAGGAPGRRPSLVDIVREQLAARPLDADIDRALLIERAVGYLEDAQLTFALPTPGADG